MNARRGEVETFQQHASSEPQLRRVQSRSKLETERPPGDFFVSYMYSDTV